MFEKGESIGPYQVVQQLGQGGMATVYKAYHANLDRYVALKVLHPALKQTEGFLARFQREAQLVAKLEHPNIVAIYDFDEYQGNPYLVMRYIEGTTLKIKMQEGALDMKEVVRIVDAVGSGLAYAHSMGILHRDIKPSNIMLTSDEGVFITDFGLARMAQVGDSTLSRDMMIGTPQYISPEQAKGDRVDSGTDIYSFGVVIYELLVGQVPFSADTPYAIVHDHIFTPLPMPREVNPDIPEGVERFLLRALAKERSERFGTAAQMAEAFSLAARGMDIVESSDGQPVTVERTVVESEPDTPSPEPTPVPTPLASAVPTPAGTFTPPEEIKPPATPKPRRQRSKPSRAWAIIGLLLLVAVLAVGGFLIGQIVIEQYRFVYGLQAYLNGFLVV